MKISMNAKSLSLCLFSVLLVALNASAHDPKEHMKDGEKPQCAAMKDIDMAKMDGKDPVVQAMMKKCNEQLHQSEGHMTEHMAAHGDNDMQEHMNHQGRGHGAQQSQQNSSQNVPQGSSQSSSQNSDKPADEHKDHH